MELCKEARTLSKLCIHLTMLMQTKLMINPGISTQSQYNHRIIDGFYIGLGKHLHRDSVYTTAITILDMVA